MNTKKSLLTEDVINGQRRIHQEIDEMAQALGLKNDDVWPLTDGVYDKNIADYCKSSPRIMWILKQPYDDIRDGKAFGGGWNVNGAFNNDDAPSNRTWQPIVYTTYGIWNHMLWSDMPYIRDDISMMDVLKDIAYINVDKMPGLTRTSDTDQKLAYERWEGIIEKQIQLYDPQVICFANTFWLFKKDWKIDERTKHKEIPLGNDKFLLAYEIDGRLFLDAYHPAQSTVSRETYVDSIINAVNDFMKGK